MIEFEAIGFAVIGLSLWLRLDPTLQEMVREDLPRINNSNVEMDEVKIAEMVELKNQMRFGVGLTN